MRIASLALHPVRIPLLEPFRISNGVVAEKDAILVELRTAEGVTGWGEASPMAGSFYSPDTPESVARALRERLIPLALSAGEFEPPHFYEWLRAHPGDSFAKAGLEGAVWDAHAQTAGAPLWRALGAARRPVPSGVALGIYDTLEELLDRVRQFTAAGYQRVKIKIQPGWDVVPVDAVRRAFPKTPLMVDANGAYTLAEREVFRELDRFGLMMIEQPLAREALEEAAELQRGLRTPLCADESAESLEALERIIALGAARIINIKVQRVGGLSEARILHQRALRAGLACWVGTMPELGVASAQGLAFAMRDGFAFPTDLEASRRWYVADLTTPELEIDSAGFLHAPENGFVVNRQAVEQWRPIPLSSTSPSTPRPESSPRAPSC
jgi:O-succinylbenzoate synthase